MQTEQTDIVAALLHTSHLVTAAQRACEEWEKGGDAEAVGITAEEALNHAAEALASVRLEDGGLAVDGMPETRRHRLVEAAQILLFAGTDEHGESDDLAFSAELFRRAAAW